MIYLCVLNQSVTPADFGRGPGQCQNLDCLAPLEPPYHSARLCLPGGELETVLCSNCLPRPTDGVFPQIWLQVVDPGQGPGRRPQSDTPSAQKFRAIRLSDLPAPPPPAPEGPRKRWRQRPLTWRALARLESRLVYLRAAVGGLRTVLKSERLYHRTPNERLFQAPSGASVPGRKTAQVIGRQEEAPSVGGATSSESDLVELQTRWSWTPVPDRLHHALACSGSRRRRVRTLAASSGGCRHPLGRRP